MKALIDDSGLSTITLACSTACVANRPVVWVIFDPGLFTIVALSSALFWQLPLHPLVARFCFWAIFALLLFWLSPIWVAVFVPLPLFAKFCFWIIFTLLLFVLSPVWDASLEQLWIHPPLLARSCFWICYSYLLAIRIVSKLNGLVKTWEDAATSTIG